MPTGDKGIHFKSRKVIVGHEEGNTPELEPLYINHAEFLQVGADVYLDLGIIKPDDILKGSQEATSPSAPTTIDFFVLSRVAMSLNTFAHMQKQSVELFDKIRGKVSSILNDEYLQPPRQSE